MGRSILRDGDERGEKIVSEFLDKHFYIECEDFHRVVDKVQQIKGVDTTFVKNGFQYVCDEKAALKYVNKNLQTFSMELSFFNAADNISIGWLLDSNKINNSFLFCWIDSAINDVLSSSDDIVIMEVALVRRNKIIDYLNSISNTFILTYYTIFFCILQDLTETAADSALSPFVNVFSAVTLLSGSPRPMLLGTELAETGGAIVAFFSASISCFVSSVIAVAPLDPRHHR